MDKLVDKPHYVKIQHIIFDAFGVRSKNIGKEEFVFSLLMEIPPLIGMRVLSGPNVIRDYQTGHGGVTGFAIINFSHISIHTFSDTKEIFIDVFSCKKFDYEVIKKYLFKKLNVKPEQVETLEVKYPWKPLSEG